MKKFNSATHPATRSRSAVAGPHAARTRAVSNPGSSSHGRSPAGTRPAHSSSERHTSPGSSPGVAKSSSGWAIAGDQNWSAASAIFEVLPARTTAACAMQRGSTCSA